MFKGDSAAIETIRRRPYHQAYYRANKPPGRKLVPCPTCGKSMYRGREHCARCEFRFHRWDCCECGREKTKTSRRCMYCGAKESNRLAGRVVNSHELNPFCPNERDGAANCETRSPHKHCECGWPMRTDANACHICLFEQSRIEYKVWPKESAA